MNLKEITVVQALQGVSLPVAAAGLIWVHSYYLGIIHEAVVGVEIRIIERFIDDLERTQTVYEVRMETAEGLNPEANNQYRILLNKIEQARQDIRDLRDSL